jgi:hypothetical protein
MPVAALLSSIAPVASVLPSADSATLEPSSSLPSVLDALTYACCDHVVPARANTYTAPALAALLSP